MPSPLLMAADILLDVARTVDAADRTLLEDAAAELAACARAASSAEGVRLAPFHAVPALVPAIRGVPARELLVN